MIKIITLISFVVFLSTGYGQTYINEDFSSFTMPVQPPLASGWTNVDSLNYPLQSDSIWRFDNPGTHPLVPPFAGNVAIVDSDFYGSQSSQDCYLSTPSFDASSATTVILEFDHFFEGIVFSGGFKASLGEIQIFDGVNWVSDTTFTVYTNYNHIPKREVIDISGPAAGNSIAQVRFRYAASWGWQWTIDNVVIFQPIPDDISVYSVDSTDASCNSLTANEKICATIVNVGTNTITSFPLNYSINGGVIITETVTDTLNPGDSISYCFNTTADFSSVGSYDINVFSSLRNDLNNINDTAKGTNVHKSSIASYPYSEGFEMGHGGWIPHGINNSWAIGVPSGATINSAANGANAFVTNLTGDYNNSENSYVLSPCFDFTNLNAPQFKMNVWWDLEKLRDGVSLQMTIDNGVTWNQVGAFLDPYNWYNDNSIGSLHANGFSGEGWSGDTINTGSNGWTLVEHNLMGAANQSSVQLRIVFSSDNSVTREGFAFDDIVIQEAPPIDGGVVALVAPASICEYGTSDSVKVAIANFGSGPITNIPVAYSFNGNPVIIDTVINTINVGDTAIFTFTQGTVNLSSVGAYPFSIYTDISTDGNILNDSLSVVVENSLKIAPYTENFDLFTSGTGYTNAGSVLMAGWTANPSPPPSLIWGASIPPPLFWGARDTTRSRKRAGPSVDHTGLGGNFIYVEGVNGETGNIAELISPCIDLSALTAARLEFWYHKFGWNMGTMYIDIFDGSTWTTIDSIVGETQVGGTDPYLLRRLNISSYIGNYIQVKFRSSRKPSVGNMDMAIDDFRIIEPVTNDVSLIAITSSFSNCNLSTADSVKILLANDGVALLDTVPVTYEIGGSIINDTNFTTINPGDTIEFTFSATVTFLASGLYELVAYADLSTDGDRSYDTISVSINKSPLFSVPYTENFETSNGDWIAYGGNSSWAWGQPLGTYIDTAGSGSKAWVTNLSGAYNDIENSYLESPCFDFSGLSNDPVLTYLSIFKTEVDFDFGWVEQSRDGGVTWTKVVDNGGAVNWYNNVVNQYWTGNNLGGARVWDITSNVLTGAAGNSDVKIRFALTTDRYVSSEGFGIDSVSIDIVTSTESVKNSDALTFSIFPNPSIGQFTLIVPSTEYAIKAEIFDIKGQLVYSRIIAANDTRRNLIDLSKNAKGVYFVKISNRNHSIVEKIILQ